MAYIKCISNEGTTSSVVDLGTGTTFDVSDYAGYGSFTNDNFMVTVESFSASAKAQIGVGNCTGGNVTASVTPTINKSYDTSTGVLTVSASNTTASQNKNVTSIVLEATAKVESIVYHAYLVR